MGELLFRVYQRTGRSGQKTWSARFIDSDGAVLKTLSLPQAKTVRQAEKAAKECLAQGIVSSKSDPIVKDYLIDFWKTDSVYARKKALQDRPLSERYVTDCAGAVRVHLVPFLGNRRMSQMNLGWVDEWILERSEAGIGPHRINTALKALHVAVKYFCRTNRIPDLLVGIEKIAEKPQPRQILTPEEMAALVTVEETTRTRATVLLAAFCGLRAGEIRGLQWEDVDFGHRLISVRHNYVSDKEGLKMPKWHKSRTVPLPDVVVKALEAVRDENHHDSPYVIFNEGRADRPAERCTLTRGFERVLTKIGVTPEDRKARHLCLHGLRNLFVSHSRRVGIPDYVVQRLVGHSTLEMTDHYTRVNVTDLEDALAKLNKASESATPKENSREAL